MQLRSIRNEYLNEVVNDFRKLRKEYELELDRLRRKSRCKSDFNKKRVEMTNSMLSLERFAKILPTDIARIIRNDMINEMIINENTLYTLGNVILDRIGGGHEMQFWYTGRCPKCRCDTEKKIDVEKPVMDYSFINESQYSVFSEKVMCESCSEATEPVKTSNLYLLKGDNDFNSKLMRIRIKSQGRLLTKVVKLCSGKDSDISNITDVNGMTIACRKENDCRNIPELMIKYHKGEDLEVKDYFVINKREGESGTRYESEGYHLYLKGGKLKKKDGHPIEAKKREREFYKALHFPIEYSGITIEMQVKDMDIWRKENDPKSPLFHGTYSQRRSADCVRQYHEEKSETAIKGGEFEQRFENFLVGTGVLGPYNPDLYKRDMLLW